MVINDVFAIYDCDGDYDYDGFVFSCGYHHQFGG